MSLDAPEKPSSEPTVTAGVPEGASSPVPAQPVPGADKRKVPIFGARALARRLGAEADELRAQLERLGALEVADLERRKTELEQQLAAQRSALEAERAAAAAVTEREAQAQAEQARRQMARRFEEEAALTTRLQELRERVVITEEAEILQEVGVYEYRHPLSDSVAYASELKRLRDRIKTMNRKDGGAAEGSTDWTVNGSRPQGRAMVRDFSKLMLRAYNAEADNLVRGLKPYKLDSAIDRLTKVATTIVKLGDRMGIRITDAYHRVRIEELELTADYLEKLAEEKDREREERERLREERKVQQEMERERARLEKERQHYLSVLDALIAKGDEEAAQRLRDELDDVERAIADVDYRAANIRAGYVYVISNVGAFGDRIVKIGLTRRLDPMERVRELGDASVPFRFDVHALLFSKDAVGIENALHVRLADRRVNRVNQRREFFYATPAEVKEHLLQVTGELIQYDELPEALEFHQSQTVIAGG